MKKLSLSDIKAAIFDMDGTLIDSLGIWGVLWEKLGSKFLGDKSFLPTKDDDKRVRTTTLRDAMALIHENYSVGQSVDEVLDEANRIISDFYENDVEMKPGAFEFLRYLHEHGVKMCIASASAPDLVSIAMKHCGIDQYFDRVFSCQEVGKGKEFPDVFLVAREYFGESFDNTWVFEDSLVALQTAVNAGFKTVGIYDKFGFGHDVMKQIATRYVDEGETLFELI